jgi:tRNA(fMet)-specific endonuclease VapC
MFRIFGTVTRRSAHNFFSLTFTLGFKKAGTPIPSNDVWIAALCRLHSLPIVSRDRHFDLVPGIKRIEW